MERSLQHLLAYSLPAGTPDTWLVVACAIAVGAVLGVLAIGLAQYYHERGNINVTTQLAFDLVAPAPAAVVVDVAPVSLRTTAPEAPTVKRTPAADRCPLCGGHLVDDVCDRCGMAVMR